MTKLKRILLVSDLLYLLAGGFLGPIYALYVKKIGGDLLDASFTFAVFMATSGIVVFLLSYLEEKQTLYRKQYVVYGYFLGVVGYFLYLFVNSPLFLLGVQMILGLSAALKDPSYDALYSEFGKKRLVFSWGQWEAVDYFALATSALIGGFVAVRFGFQTLLLVMLLSSIFSFIVSLFLLQHKRKVIHAGV